MHVADRAASLLRNGSLAVALLLPVALCLAALGLGSRSPQARPAGGPPIMLWAWDTSVPKGFNW